MPASTRQVAKKNIQAVSHFLMEDCIANSYALRREVLLVFAKNFS